LAGAVENCDTLDTGDFLDTGVLVAVGREDWFDRIDCRRPVVAVGFRATRTWGREIKFYRNSKSGYEFFLCFSRLN